MEYYIAYVQGPMQKGEGGVNGGRINTEGSNVSFPSWQCLMRISYYVWGAAQAAKAHVEEAEGQGSSGRPRPRVCIFINARIRDHG